MRRKANGARLCVTVLALFCLMPAAEAGGQLVAYTAEGPAMALQEAAGAFQRTTGTEVRVEVRHKLPFEWQAKAAADADLVFSSAEYLMSGYLNSPDLKVDRETVRSLYMRPSVVLVRPGNPKGIADLPDLTRTGIKVMAVCGTEHTALWEDMLGRGGNAGMIDGIRRNLAAFLPDAAAAMQRWRDDPSLDAWITWNIWHAPMRKEASVVTVSEPFRIWRQCSTAMTARGKGNPAAARFIEFLLSREGQQIFESWGWSALSSDFR